MGNTSVRTNKHTEIPHQQTLEKLYQTLCSYGILDQKLFLEHFDGPSAAVSQNIFNRFFIDLLNSDAKTVSLFVERASKILEAAYLSQSEKIGFYFDLLSHKQTDFAYEDLYSILHSSCCYGLQLRTTDLLPQEDLLLTALVKSCLQGKVSVSKKELLTSLNHNCPLIFGGLESWLYERFTRVPLKAHFTMLPCPKELSSHECLLSPSLLWFLCTILSSCFICMENSFNESEEEDDVFTWNLLYDSHQHGLSLNRFKHKIMNYKSATVTLLQFSSGVRLLLALDEAWRDSPEKFGGPYCQLIEFSPDLHVIEANSAMVYLKELGRSIPTGLLIGSETRAKVQVDKDLSAASLTYKNITNDSLHRVEIWGCGGVKARRSQEDVKKWERKEIEKRKKVKLPGQWDTDKAILEMGGVCVNHSQR